MEVVNLSDGSQVAKTENSKSVGDFRVKLVNGEHPQGLTIKHAHFAIDFYGKVCRNRKKALKVLDAIVEIWHRRPVDKALQKYKPQVKGLSGYPLEYILYALNWILDQEDINFRGRRPKRQREFDELLERFNIQTPPGRLGSQITIALFCYIAEGIHPVESFHKVGLRI
ncbi:MAG: hypothetical protein QXR87_07180 [Candidatus Hadarchaeales archaeon]